MRFSRKLTVEPWPEDGLEFDLEADARELEDLARRLELVEVTAVRARGHLKRGAEPGEIHLVGRLEAHVVQTCVVSLEDVPARIDEPVERRFRLGAEPPSQGGAELVLDPDEVDVEPLEGSVLDLGEVLAEELALALHPYPRAENAYALVPDLGPHVTLGPAEESPAGPFAVLRDLHSNPAP